MKKGILGKIILVGGIFVLVLIIGMFAVVDRYQKTKYAVIKKRISEQETETTYINQANIPLSPVVESYRDLVLRIATKYGIGQYVDLLLAIMMQESGGLCQDVFQCSESLGKPPNSINTETSIEQACKIMSNYLSASEVRGILDIPRIRLALQCYNFGGGFMTFVNQNGGEWTQELVNEYARIKSGGVRNTGSRVERLGEWRYGDQYYTNHVLRYYPYLTGQEESEGTDIPLENRMEWLFPDGIPQSADQMSDYLQTVSVPIVDENGVENTMQLTVHKKIAGNVTRAFTELKEMGFPVRSIDTAAYCWRNMVSGNSVSAHAYGVAIDVNWNSNPMVGQTGGTYNPGVDPYAVTEDVVKIFQKYGFYWGGNWSSSKDYMHFSFINK